MLAQVALFHGSSPVNQYFRLVAVSPNVIHRWIYQTPSFDYYSLFNSFRHSEERIDFLKIKVELKFHFGLEIKNGLIMN